MAGQRSKSRNRSCRSSQDAWKFAVKTIKQFAFDAWDNELFSISIFQKLFFIQGFWPNVDNKKYSGYILRYINPRGLILCAIYLSCISCPLAAFLSDSKELIGKLEPIALIFVAHMVGFEAFSLVFLSSRFKELMTALDVMRQRGSMLSEQPKTISKRTKILSLLTLVYYVECVLNTVVFSLGMIPQLLRKRKFFTSGWYPYDSAVSPLYEITLMGWVTSLTSGSCLIALVNAFLMATLVQAIGQFQLLNHNLKAMHPPGLFCNVLSQFGVHRGHGRIKREDVLVQRRIRPNKRRGDFFQSTDVQMKIMIDRCTRHHQAILSYVSCINSAFNFILLQQYSCSLFPSLLAIILITHSTEINMKILLVAALVVVCNLTLGLYCYLANKITEESIEVRESIFSSDWLTASENFKRSMRMMMCRSNQPAVVRVGGFVTLSRESYLSVLKMTYTYYMAARATIKRISI